VGISGGNVQGKSPDPVMATATDVSCDVVCRVITGSDAIRAAVQLSVHELLCQSLSHSCINSESDNAAYLNDFAI